MIIITKNADRNRDVVLIKNLSDVWAIGFSRENPIVGIQFKILKFFFSA